MSKEKINTISIAPALIMALLITKAQADTLKEPEIPSMSTSEIAAAKEELLRVYNNNFLKIIPDSYKQLRKSKRGALNIRHIDQMVRFIIHYDRNSKQTPITHDISSFISFFDRKPKYEDERRLKEKSFIGAVDSKQALGPNPATYEFMRKMAKLLKCDRTVAINTKHDDEFMRLWYVANLKISNHLTKKNGQTVLNVNPDSNVQFGCELFRSKGDKLYGTWTAVLKVDLKYAYKNPKIVIQINKGNKK